MPILLLIVMFAMGLALTIADFRHVVRAPKLVLVGLLCQYGLMPFLAVAICHTFSLPDAYAIGLILVACCPGGVLSNIMTFLARADLALSVTLTSVSTFLSIVMTPLMFLIGTNLVVENASELAIGLDDWLVTVAGLILVPVAAGMFVRHKWPTFAIKAEKPSRQLANVVIFVVTASILAPNVKQLPHELVAVGLPVILQNIAALAIAYSVPWLLRFQPIERKTISLEAGLQNTTLSLTLAFAFFADDDRVAIPGAIFGLSMIATGFTLAIIWGRAAKRRQIQAETASTVSTEK